MVDPGAVLPSAGRIGDGPDDDWVMDRAGSTLRATGLHGAASSSFYVLCAL